MEFSLNRLGLLIRRQWAERSRLYILMMGAIAGLLAVAFFIWGLANQDRIWMETAYIFLFVGLFLGGSIMAAMTFSDLSQRTTGIYYLAVPATHAEKLLCGILYSQVFFNVAYLLIFFVLRAVAFAIIRLNPHVVLENMPGENDLHEVFHYLIIVYTAVQTLFLMGSVYFERFAFVKTIVSTVLIIVGLVLFVVYVIHPITGNLQPAGEVGVFRVFNDDGAQYIYTLPLWISRFIWFMFKFMWAPVFWVAAYFRLKEKEL